MTGIPDLIIEILSPSTAYYDMIEKKEIYEKLGVKEYWIVDPKKESVEIFLNVNHCFELNQRIVKKGFAKSYVMKGFAVSLEKVFYLY
jgi:Uma2 family endonuclease